MYCHPKLQGPKVAHSLARTSASGIVLVDVHMHTGWYASMSAYISGMRLSHYAYSRRHLALACRAGAPLVNYVRASKDSLVCWRGFICTLQPPLPPGYGPACLDSCITSIRKPYSKH